MTAGERWTERALTELRAERYSPRAWSRFLARSFERAAETRRERAHEHRQVLALAALGALAWAVVGASGRPWLALAGASWWLVVVLMVDWHLGMLEDEDGVRLERLGLANVLAIGRAGIVPALAVASPVLLAALLIPAGVADGLDGPIARARRETTRLGHWLDGGVDGLVLGAAALGAARAGILPVWAAALVLARHGLQWLAVGAAFFLRAHAPARDTIVSGKLPGLVLFAGLALGALHAPGAIAAVVAGSLGGLAVVCVTLARAYRLQAVS